QGDSAIETTEDEEYRDDSNIWYDEEVTEKWDNQGNSYYSVYHNGSDGWFYEETWSNANGATYYYYSDANWTYENHYDSNGIYWENHDYEGWTTNDGDYALDTNGLNAAIRLDCYYYY